MTAEPKYFKTQAEWREWLAANFEKRLRNFIAKTREGKMVTGYGGIEKYY